MTESATVGHPREARRDTAIVVLLLALLLAWDASALDLAVVRAFGSPTGFAWRDHWFTRDVVHQGGRALGWVVFAAMAWNLRRPLPFARALPRRDRVWWFLTTLACLLVIPVLKQLSLTSCPWSLAEFGGVARYVPHWAFGVADGGSGGCFPSGHASGAFSFLAGGFALRRTAPRAARIWFAATIVAGLAFGFAQTMRGAHYPSHTLWTAWICLAITAVSYHAFGPGRRGA